MKNKELFKPLYKDLFNPIFKVDDDEPKTLHEKINDRVAK